MIALEDISILKLESDLIRVYFRTNMYLLTVIIGIYKTPKSKSLVTILISN